MPKDAPLVDLAGLLRYPGHSLRLVACLLLCDCLFSNCFVRLVLHLLTNSKCHDEYRQCNPGSGIHMGVLLGYDNSYTTPLEIPFLIRSPSWWRYMVGGPL